MDQTKLLRQREDQIVMLDNQVRVEQQKVRILGEALTGLMSKFSADPTDDPLIIKAIQALSLLERPTGT